MADELAIHHPLHHIDLATLAVLVGGPLVYLLGNAFYKRVVYGQFPPSHLAGIALLLLTIPLGLVANRLVVAAVTSGVLVIVAVWQSRQKSQPLVGRTIPAH